MLKVPDQDMEHDYIDKSEKVTLLLQVLVMILLMNRDILRNYGGALQTPTQDYKAKCH